MGPIRVWHMAAAKLLSSWLLACDSCSCSSSLAASRSSRASAEPWGEVRQEGPPTDAPAPDSCKLPLPEPEVVDPEAAASPFCWRCACCCCCRACRRFPRSSCRARAVAPRTSPALRQAAAQTTGEVLLVLEAQGAHWPRAAAAPLQLRPVHGAAQGGSGSSEHAGACKANPQHGLGAAPRSPHGWQ